MIRSSLSLLLKTFFDHLYNQFAFLYDFVASIVSFGRWKEWISAVKESIGDGRVLEVGYGPGYLLADMMSEGKNVYGIDLSPSMARLARKKILETNQPLRISIANSIYTPFPNHTFEQIVSTFPAEYFFSHLALAEFHRIIKPGGSIVLLPLVIITGPRLRHKFLAWIYQVTGQSTKDPDALVDIARARFSEQGFDLQSQIKTGSFYQLLILKARKRN